MRVVSVLLLKITEGNPRNHVCGFQELLLFMHDGITQCNRWHDRSLQWHTTWLGKNVHEWVATNWFTRLATIATALSAARCHTCNGNVCGFLLFFSWSSVARVLGKTVYGSNSRRCSGRSATERGGLHKFAKMSFVCVSRRAMQGPYICERTHSQGLHEEGCATPHHEDRRQHSTMCVVFELSEMFFLQSQQILSKQHVQAIGWKSCPSRVVRRLHGLAEWLWFLFLFFWFVEVL